MRGDFQLKLSPVLFQGLMKDFPEKVKKAGFDGIDQIANESKRMISTLTPGKDLPRGWKIKKSGNAYGRNRLLINGDDRAYKPIQLKDGRSTNLLEMLEYGTRPHEITPVKAKVLAFTVDGDQVFTKHVDHPGTKAYAFTNKTFTSASIKVGFLQIKLGQMLRQGV